MYTYVHTYMNAVSLLVGLLIYMRVSKARWMDLARSSRFFKSEGMGAASMYEIKHYSGMAVIRFTQRVQI